MNYNQRTVRWLRSRYELTRTEC